MATSIDSGKCLPSSVNGKPYGKLSSLLRACLHGCGGPQIGEVTCGGSPLSCKRDQVKMRDYADGQVAPATEAGYLTYLESPTSM